MQKPASEQWKSKQASDFEKALECLRLYSTLILDADNTISDESSMRLLYKRGFTPHWDIVVNAIKDYYGKQGFLNRNPDLCTLDALETRLIQAFQKVPQDEAAVKLKSIFHAIHLMNLREQANRILSPFPRKESWDAEKAKALAEMIYRTLGKDVSVETFTLEKLGDLRNQLNALIQTIVINFNDEFMVIRNTNKSNPNLRFFPDNNLEKCNLSFNREPVFQL